ncbi:tagatose-6-phosphate kinase [Latilactobacillus fuchuensis]|uniref:Tagatose-6-phosphate kinase n=1 Tax=Latilactobacillus fuchuensis DSM 14340 = JCM 11249 TaxID=1423747 RepID=A0A0R1RPQ7_9LACO|nr:tagatose-6-phosphate kinase [Latilactobacillus fuchuensis]KRL58689.1 Tagatose-6-phosphate kinase (phosphotagatokinase) [Latilactobacillus fuchuensis DSM 14340 = JCM 11249]MCP8858279.1 tagatose-6-phosphate kinase [Latilactobacillus fuchuensis]
MILTVTLNPAVDISYPLQTLVIDDVNRVSDVSKTAGGKGLNVSRVLHLMQQPLLATGIVGGHIGNFIKQKLDDDQIQHEFFEIQQESRNAIAILHDDGCQTEILEAGPTISADDAQAFMQFYGQLLTKVSTVTLSGSLPKGLGADYYAKMVEMAGNAGVKAILDTSGASLLASLKATVKPTLIKPNETEIAQLLDQPIDVTDIDGLKTALQAPIFAGVEWIVVSMGAAGAFAKHNDHFYRVSIPKIHVENPVGSGDSTLAGLAMAIDTNESDEVILKTGMTTGMLNTMEKQTGFVNPELFKPYFAKVTFKEV